MFFKKQIILGAIAMAFALNISAEVRSPQFKKIAPFPIKAGGTKQLRQTWNCLCGHTYFGFADFDKDSDLDMVLFADKASRKYVYYENIGDSANHDFGKERRDMASGGEELKVKYNG